MNARMKINNFVSLDILRAYMAWWVVIDHGVLLLGAGNDNISINKDSFLRHMPHFIIKILTMGPTPVHVFMIISGFVISHMRLTKNEKYGKYFIRRAFRLFPIYLFCVILAIITINLHRIAYVQNPFSAFMSIEVARAASEDQAFWSHLAEHLALIHGLVPVEMLRDAQATILTPAWSLSLEWQFYLVAPFIIAIFTGEDKYIKFLMIAMAIFLPIAVNHQHAFHWEFGAFLPQVIGYFVIGILSRQIIDLIEIKYMKSNISRLLWMVIAIGLIGFRLDRIAMAIWSFWFFIILQEANILQVRNRIATSLLKIVSANRLAALAGRWSYSTYLCHFIIYSVVVGLYGFMVEPAKMNALVLTILVVLCWPTVLLCSAILYRLIEQPGIRLGNTLGGRHDGPR